MLNRLVAPNIGFDSEIKAIEYNTNILPDNIPLYSIQDTKQSVVGLQIIFGGGKLSETQNGASYFSTNLVKSGTNKYDINYINNYFEFRGAFVHVQNGLDYNSLSLYCLTEKFKEVLPHFLELYIEPSFPPDQLEKLKKKKEQEVSVNQKKSSYWANKLLKESLFKDHPYGQSISLKDIKEIDRESVFNHWDNCSASNIKFFTLAGNFDLNLTLELLINLRNSKYRTIDRPVKSQSYSNNELIIKELSESEQTSLKIGQPIVSLEHNDYPILTLGNTLWGGYFGSRLMQTIREEKGLTYGIRSSLIHLKEASYLQISADLKKGAGNEAIELLKLELDKLVSNKLDLEEVDKVKRYIIGEYKSSVESIFDKIAKVKFIKTHKLNDTFFSKLYSTILITKPEEVQTILEKHIKTVQFHTVLVE